MTMFLVGKAFTHSSQTETFVIVAIQHSRTSQSLVLAGLEVAIYLATDLMKKLANPR